MPCVCDSSTVIVLAKSGCLDLLKALFSRVFIPPAVHREVVVRGREEGHPEVALVEAALNEKWLRVASPRKKDSGLGVLGQGEQESIELARQLGVVLLVDAAAAKTIALSRRVEAHGSIYVVLRGVREKKLSKDAATALLRRMVGAGLRLSPELFSEAYEAIRRI